MSQEVFLARDAMQTFNRTMLLSSAVTIIICVIFTSFSYFMLPDIIRSSSKEGSYQGANQAFKDSVESVNTQ